MTDNNVPTTPTEEEKTIEPATTEPVAEETPLETTPAEATEEVKEEVPAEEAEAPASGKKDFSDIVPGMTVRVHQKIRETNTKGEEKERIQVYEGIVIARQHGSEIGATITVRKISGGIGVEKIFPLNSPNVVKIEPVKVAEVRHAKLYFLRTWKKRLKETFIKK